MFDKLSASYWICIYWYFILKLFFTWLGKQNDNNMNNMWNVCVLLLILLFVPISKDDA